MYYHFVFLFLALIIYFLYMNQEKWRNRYYRMEEEHYQYQDNIRKRDAEIRLNHERVDISKVVFNKLDNKYFIIQDTLDIEGNCGVSVYLLGKNLELNKTFHSRMNQPTDLLEVAKIDLYENGDNIYHIDRIQVNDQYRENGIGTFLLQRVIEWADIREISELTLTACGAIFLVKWYEKHDFKITNGNSMHRIRQNFDNVQ